MSTQTDTQAPDWMLRKAKGLHIPNAHELTRTELLNAIKDRQAEDKSNGEARGQEIIAPASRVGEGQNSSSQRREARSAEGGSVVVNVAAVPATSPASTEASAEVEHVQRRDVIDILTLVGRWLQAALVGAFLWELFGGLVR